MGQTGLQSERRDNSKTLAQVDVSIIIVSWNVSELLIKCLKSIVEYTEGLTYEVIVVDNNSNDDTAKEVERFAARHPDGRIIFIANEKNLGFSVGNNIGLAQARGRYVLYLNPDTELLSNSVKMMFDFLESHPQYGAAGCRMVYPDGSIYHPCARGFPTPLNVFFEMAFLTKVFPRSRVLGSLDMKYWDKSDSRDVECLVGACIFVREEIVRKIGGFRDIFFMYGEDIDMCFRIVEGNWKIRYLANGTIVHHTEKSSSQVKRNNFKTVMRIESNFLFNKVNYGTSYAMYYKLIILLGALFRLLLLMPTAAMVMVFNWTRTSKWNKVVVKHYRMVRWALGFEGWVKKVIF